MYNSIYIYFLFLLFFVLVHTILHVWHPVCFHSCILYGRQITVHTRVFLFAPRLLYNVFLVVQKNAGEIGDA